MSTDRDVWVGLVFLLVAVIVCVACVVGNNHFTRECEAAGGTAIIRPYAKRLCLQSDVVLDLDTTTRTSEAT